jgi:hypothetical protein
MFLVIIIKSSVLVFLLLFFKELSETGGLILVALQTPLKSPE